MSSGRKLCAISDRSTAPARKPPERDSDGAYASAGARVDVARYFEQYTAVANVVVDHWMPALSGAEFKVLLLFIRDTIGQEAKRASGSLNSELTIEEIRRRTGLNRESVMIAIRGLEETGDGLIVVERNHRKASRYGLNIRAVLAPRVGKSDSSERLRSENPTQARPLESENPTLNGSFGSENPTPYKEINKAAAAAAVLTPEEWAEVRCIEQRANVQLDGKNAAALKAGAESANLTLSHLRWFLGKETFAAARNRTAVLLTIAREFPQRVAGVVWPADLNSSPSNERGISLKELVEP